jgi:ribosomal protein S19
MRSLWKLPFISPIFFKNNNLFKKKTFKIFKTNIRNSCIPKVLVNKRLNIYNGKKYNNFIVRPTAIGFKFGEFSFTKKKSLNMHVKKKKKKE